MANILFVVDELPYPPRNGVTIPSYHYLSGLAKHHTVDLLWLRQASDQVAEDRVLANRGLVHGLYTLDLRPASIAKAVIGELSGKRPLFASAVIDEAEGTRTLRHCDPDVIWYTPIRPFCYASSIDACLPARYSRFKVAAISDPCAAANQTKRFWEWGWPRRSRGRIALNWARSFVLNRIEQRQLKQADCILVQSEKDKRWIDRDSSAGLRDKLLVLSNGVTSDLLQLDANRKKCAFGHIGSLAVDRNERAVNWVVNRVLPRVLRVCPDAVFEVLGPPGSRSLMSRLARTSAVNYRSRVENMDDFLGSLRAIVVKNYKHFGVINRTLEAMAAGVVVVGEPGAFNGIERFEHGTHGFSTNGTNETASALAGVLGNEQTRLQVVNAARDLIAADFQWSDRIEAANVLIEHRLVGKAKAA